VQKTLHARLGETQGGCALLPDRYGPLQVLERGLNDENNHGRRVQRQAGVGWLQSRSCAVGKVSMHRPIPKSRVSLMVILIRDLL
jgi:hypothetical protein